MALTDLLTLLLAALAVLLLLWQRFAPPRDDQARRLVERLDALDRHAREEAARARAEQATQAQALRQELLAQLQGFQAQLLASQQAFEERQRAAAAELASALREQLGQLGTELRQQLQRQLQDQTATRQLLADTLREQGEQLLRTGEVQAQQQRERLEAITRGVAELTQRLEAGQVQLRKELSDTLKGLGESLQRAQGLQGEQQRERLEAVARTLGELTRRLEEAQAQLRTAVEQRLDQLRADNAEKLEKIRHTVDEQLQGTLEKRLGESFRQVSERLEQVHKGLGEMQQLATGVGDLKRVLTNVKTRGIWGEVQLGNLLEQILTPEQYLREAQVNPETRARVEYAIRLPGRGEGASEVLLPIDAKFPQADYERLLAAAEQGDAEAVEAAARALETAIRLNAQEIRDKYIHPPHTTDFALLFLPTEGLYAELLRRPGLADQLQREYRVTITGPTTLAATLNALQMGFRTLAIQKRSSEVWKVLESVKTEFARYGEVMRKVQKKLNEASNTVEEVHRRSRAIETKLKDVGSLPDGQAQALLGLAAPPSALDAEPDAAEE